MLIVLPWPPAGLSPNKRGHWAVKHKARKPYREACRVLARDAKNRRPDLRFPLGPVVQAQIIFHAKENRRRDVDNLIASLKSGLDAIVDAGVLADDSADKLVILPPRIAIDGTRKVTIDLRPFDGWGSHRNNSLSREKSDAHRIGR